MANGSADKIGVQFAGGQRQTGGERAMSTTSAEDPPASMTGEITAFFVRVVMMCCIKDRLPETSRRCTIVQFCGPNAKAIRITTTPGSWQSCGTENIWATSPRKYPSGIAPRE